MKNNGKNPEGFENEYQSINRAERARNAPERADHSDPPDTPLPLSGIEPGPESARSPGITVEVAAIGPAYEWNLITIHDEFGLESRWLAPFGTPVNSDEFKLYRISHEHNWRKVRWIGKLWRQIWGY